jgi:hypothetical protein
MNYRQIATINGDGSYPYYVVRKCRYNVRLLPIENPHSRGIKVPTENLETVTPVELFSLDYSFREMSLFSTTEQPLKTHTFAGPIISDIQEHVCSRDLADYTVPLEVMDFPQERVIGFKCRNCGMRWGMTLRTLRTTRHPGAVVLGSWAGRVLFTMHCSSNRDVQRAIPEDWHHSFNTGEYIRNWDPETLLNSLRTIRPLLENPGLLRLPDYIHPRS